jgi:hypothetical protein
MEHHCQQERTIEDIRHTLYGNGQPGLKDQVIEMKGDLKHLINNTNGIISTLEDLNTFKSELTGAQKAIDKNKNKMRWLIGIIVTISVVLVGIIIDIITK